MGAAPEHGRLIPAQGAPPGDPALAAWFAAAANWPEAVLPDYHGGSNANLVASIQAAFGVPPAATGPALLPPLHAELLDPRALAGARVIVLLILDGLGRPALDRALEAGRIQALGASRGSVTLTSVFPPTTAAALTSLQTGTPPGVHGMAAYTLYLAAQQCVVNMITWRASGGAEPAAPLPEPRSFLNGPTLYRNLQRHGIETVHISRNTFAGSALTEAQAAGVTFAGHRTLAELTQLIQIQAAKPGRRFIFAYWDGFDALAHSYASDSAATALELRLIDLALGEGLLGPLERTADDVALLITADHGHIPTPVEQRVDLAKLPRLVERWGRRPSGEPRSLGLALPDLDERRRVAEFVGSGGVVLDAQDAISAGLFGRGALHSDLLTRIGDTLLLARGLTSYTFPGMSSQSIGGHGSLTAEEMLVPLLTWRFQR